MTAKKTIVICSSGSAYKHVNELADELEVLGYRAVVPATAEKMRASGNYDINAVKTWYKDPTQHHIKIGKMNEHFKKVAAGDAILIVNDDKNGQPKYIGPNTLMEWGIAVYLNKPVYILNQVPKNANTYEEVLTATAVLNGDLTKIKL